MSITGANATFLISVASLFPTPQPLQGFAADDAFGGDAVQSIEHLMGVDGILSFGFTFKEIVMNIHLQADSVSNFIFDTWFAQQQALRQVFTASATILFTDLGTKWTATNGGLTSWKPFPDVKKLLQPRTHQLTWQSISPAPV